MSKKQRQKAATTVKKAQSAVSTSLAMADRAIEKRRESATTLGKVGFGTTSSPLVKKAMMAINYYYGLDPALGDVIIMGDKMYITAQAYMKKLDERSSTNFKGMPFRWVKRVATKEELADQGYADRKGARCWYVELYPPEGHGELCITSAYGEADSKNCQLQNSSKEVGDPRVLNRQAIKRAQHECTRDVVVFRLPSPDEFEAKTSMALEEFTASGVQIILDDGLLVDGQHVTGPPVEQALAAPTPEEVTSAAVSEPKEDPSKPEPEKVPDDNEEQSEFMNNVESGMEETTEPEQPEFF